MTRSDGRLRERRFLLVLAGLGGAAFLVMLVVTRWEIGTPPARSETFLCLLLSCFLLPFLAVVIFRLPIYNNFRHLLFIAPPLFVMGSIALEHFLQVGSRPAWLLPILTITLLVPGVVGIVRLHPYEYIYYNGLVGGVGGAHGNYELDFWCTSYREAVQAVNRIAPAAAEVAVWGPFSAAEPFFREDLKPSAVPVSPRDAPVNGSLALGCSWATIDPDFFPTDEVVWTVEREGARLAVVKRHSPAAAPGEAEPRD